MKTVRRKTHDRKSVAKELVAEKVTLGVGRQDATDEGNISSKGTARTYSEVISVAIGVLVTILMVQAHIRNAEAHGRS